MKHRIIIEYETPDNLGKGDIFHGKIAEMHCVKALTDYLHRNEEIRRKSLTSLYNVISSTNESKYEIPR